MALSANLAAADSLSDAHRLLRAANIEHQFEQATQRQVRAIIRTYSSIVSMNTAVSLPAEVTQRINDCYTAVYAWDNFADGLAEILATNLDAGELRLLIDFYSNLGLPPHEIERFKQLIGKSRQIQASSQEYMWANSASCVEHDSELILDYIATQRLPVKSTLAIE